MTYEIQVYCHITLLHMLPDICGLACSRRPPYEVHHERLYIALIVVVIRAAQENTLFPVPLLCYELGSPLGCLMHQLMAIIAKQLKVLRVEGDALIVDILRSEENLVVHLCPGLCLAKLAEASVDGHPVVDVGLPGSPPRLAPVELFRKLAGHGRPPGIKISGLPVGFR